jgi:N-acetylglucosamine kinase-like BadF-type ATPase
MALAALRAVAMAADGRGPQTVLTERLLEKLQISQPQELVRAVYGNQLDRTALAALAPVVIEAAEAGDAVASGIIDQAAQELADMAASVARQLGLTDRPFPLAQAGGVLTGSAMVQRQLEAKMRMLGLSLEAIRLAAEPARGALKLAAQYARSG